MERQLGHITVIILKPSDCAGCPRRLAIGETAVRDQRGYFHPACYSEALCADHGHQEARKEGQRARARPR